MSGGRWRTLDLLGAARHRRLAATRRAAAVYCTARDALLGGARARLLGFGPSQKRAAPADADYRLDPAALAKAVRADRAAGLRPFCVVANAGTTNTGAVDPLPALADYCEREGLWLHADGAYGAAAAVCARGRAALEGLGRVHSLSLDPHKWLFQPFEIGCTLVREESWLAETFAVHPEYLQDTRIAGTEVNFGERGVQLTRRFRALKLWMTLQVFGRERVAAAVERGSRTPSAEAELRRRPGWEIMTQYRMGVVALPAEGLSRTRRRGK